MEKKEKMLQAEFQKCRKCNEIVGILEVNSHDYMCPKCGAYFPVPATERIRMIADEGSFRELFTDVRTGNPLRFPGYEEKILQEQEKNSASSEILTGLAAIDGIPVALCVMNADFMMGSMGRTVGEKIFRLMETAARERLPLIMFTASGGARMQEGIISLMQMGKTVIGTRLLEEAGCLYIVVETSPTTGGVSASFATLGDIVLAEPGALICFAGPRIVEQTIKQKLPAGFQLAEDVLAHGFLDGIVERKEMKKNLAQLLKFYGSGKEKQQETEE